MIRLALIGAAVGLVLALAVIALDQPSRDGTTRSTTLPTYYDADLIWGELEY